MSACEEEVGSPHHQVSRSQTMAPSSPASTTYWVTMLELDHALADGFGDGGAEQKGGEEVEKRGPEHGQSRRQHAGRNHGGDAVGGIVKAVDEVEDERRDDGDDQQNQSSAHGYALLD